MVVPSGSTLTLDIFEREPAVAAQHRCYGLSRSRRGVRMGELVAQRPLVP
jgi:hypothetical protein